MADTGTERTRPKIKALCQRCGITDEDVRRGSAIVSPAGVAHFGEDDGDTSCGIDATGSNWWWPL